ncbi:unnamed protein product [Psylliodes chrysocephalus]|uniref:Uncharacterized protein n=1 Tax=Psylliodes chrysocephalus TaxID=3402493 RepID=A0A9P0GDU7_9CUCU|nr:unnamed protein product [Psylliodes chrysocephala]
MKKLSFYNLCITDVKNANPIFYTWTEEQAGKGSTKVSSALLNFLKTCDYNRKKVLKLFCDGCGGQNKNNIVIHILMYSFQSTKVLSKRSSLHFLFEAIVPSLPTVFLEALYGEWREIDNLNFYKDIIDDENLTIVNNNNDDDVNERCDCLEDDCCGVHT